MPRQTRSSSNLSCLVTLVAFLVFLAAMGFAIGLGLRAAGL